MRIKTSRSRCFTLQRYLPAVCWICLVAFSPEVANQALAEEVLSRFLGNYCAECHRETEASGGFIMPPAEIDQIAGGRDQWERVVRKMVTRQMPPEDAERPKDSEYDAALTTLTAELDKHARSHPQPGRTESLRRLNRTAASMPLLVPLASTLIFPGAQMRSRTATSRIELLMQIT